MAVSKKQQASVNKYITNNYDRINLTVPKGEKDNIKAHADNMHESVNSFINRAISDTIAIDNGGTRSDHETSTPLVSASALNSVNAHIEKTGETQTEFINRAISDTIDRDGLLLKMSINPAAKKDG